MRLKFIVCLLELWSEGIIVIASSFLVALLKFLFFLFHNSSLFGSFKVLLKNNAIVSFAWQMLPGWGWPKECRLNPDGLPCVFRFFS